MRRAAERLAAGVLLAGPTAIAFFYGGAFDRPRLIGGIIAWTLVAMAALLGRSPLPRSGVSQAAVAGLALLTTWTFASFAWAPLGTPALDDAQRLLLYLGVLLAAIALFGDRTVARAVEPALAAGTVVVVGYGLSDRLLPGLFELERSASAAGRLEQPLTYWNAMGGVAAIGLVLCARLAADAERRDVTRVLAAAAAGLLGAGVYLSFSRGALFALAIGLVALVLLTPTWGQLRGASLALAAGLAGALATAGFDGVTNFEGTASAREAQGAVALGLLVAIAAAAAWFRALAARRERSGRMRFGELELPRSAPGVAIVLVAIAVAGIFASSFRESGDGTEQPAQGADVERLRSFQTNRVGYWEVASATFAGNPIRGVGTAGFRAEWLRKRDLRDPAQDAHSLYLETAAELGLVGLAALALMLGGVAVATRRVFGADPALAAGPAALLIVWAAHAAIDWDWEMPAVTLIALVAAGAMCAASGAPARRAGSAATRGGPSEATSVR